MPVTKSRRSGARSGRNWPWTIEHAFAEASSASITRSSASPAAPRSGSVAFGGGGGGGGGSALRWQLARTTLVARIDRQVMSVVVQAGGPQACAKCGRALCGRATAPRTSTPEEQRRAYHPPRDQLQRPPSLSLWRLASHAQ